MEILEELIRHQPGLSSTYKGFVRHPVNLINISSLVLSDKVKKRAELSLGM